MVRYQLQSALLLRHAEEGSHNICSCRSGWVERASIRATGEFQTTTLDLVFLIDTIR